MSIGPVGPFTPQILVTVSVQTLAVPLNPVAAARHQPVLPGQAEQTTQASPAGPYLESPQMAGPTQPGPATFGRDGLLQLPSQQRAATPLQSSTSATAAAGGPGHSEQSSTKAGASLGQPSPVVPGPLPTVGDAAPPVARPTALTALSQTQTANPPAQAAGAHASAAQNITRASSHLPGAPLPQGRSSEVVAHELGSTEDYEAMTSQGPARAGGRPLALFDLQQLTQQQPGANQALLRLQQQLVLPMMSRQRLRIGGVVGSEAGVDLDEHGAAAADELLNLDVVGIGQLSLDGHPADQQTRLYFDMMNKLMRRSRQGLSRVTRNG